MKKYVYNLLIAMLSVVTFVSCAPSSEPPTSEAPKKEAKQDSNANTPSGGSKKVVIWAWDPQFNIAIMKEAGERYKKINPDFDYEVVEMAKSELEQRLHTNLASKITDNLPDIVLIEDYNAQKYLQSYKGSFADLTSNINFSDFAEYKVKLMTLDNKVYGVPFDSGVAGLFYRKDLLEQAGYTDADLKDITWDKFIEIGKIVKEKTGKGFLSYNKEDGGIMRIMMQSAGQWYFDESGKPNLTNNESLKEAMKIYKDIVDANIIVPATDWNSWVAPFNKGDVATVNTGVWIIGSIKAAADQSGKWGVAPIPKLNVSGSVNASNLGGSSWYVLDAGKNKDTAINFLNEIYAKDLDFYDTILVNNGAVGTFLPAQAGKAYNNPDEFFAGQKIYADFSEWIRNIPPVNYGIYTYEADSAVMSFMGDVYSGKSSVDDALKQAQAQLENQIK